MYYKYNYIYSLFIFLVANPVFRHVLILVETGTQQILLSTTGTAGRKCMYPKIESGRNRRFCR
jgi:hypothetical protein